MSNNNNESNNALASIAYVPTTRRRLLFGATALGFLGAGILPTRSFGQTALDPKSIPGPGWAGGAMGGRGVSVWGDSRVDFDPLLAYGRALTSDGQFTGCLLLGMEELAETEAQLK